MQSCAYILTPQKFTLDLLATIRRETFRVLSNYCQFELPNFMMNGDELHILSYYINVKIIQSPFDSTHFPFELAI